jgi:hypothetical protein
MPPVERAAHVPAPVPVRGGQQTWAAVQQIVPQHASPVGQTHIAPLLLPLLEELPPLLEPPEALPLLLELPLLEELPPLPLELPLVIPLLPAPLLLVELLLPLLPLPVPPSLFPPSPGEPASVWPMPLELPLVAPLLLPLPLAPDVLAPLDPLALEAPLLEPPTTPLLPWPLDAPDAAPLVPPELVPRPELLVEVPPELPSSPGRPPSPAIVLNSGPPHCGTATASTTAPATSPNLKRTLMPPNPYRLRDVRAHVDLLELCRLCFCLVLPRFASSCPPKMPSRRMGYIGGNVLRAALTFPRRFFSSMRRSTLDRLGLVFLRRRGGTSA